MSPLFIIIINLLLNHRVICFPKLAVLQRIRQDRNLTTFSNLLETNALSKNSLYYSQVTVFAPTNEAFSKFPNQINPNLCSYHMVYSTYKLSELIDGNLESIDSDYPPLWVKRTNDDVFINNALVLKSDYQARNTPSKYGKEQILHQIDEVLDVHLNGSIKNPTAYDFLNKSNFWSENYKVSKFFLKVILYHCENYFKRDGQFTFFIPIDFGINGQRSNAIDSYIIKGHIIKNKVLFVRPALKDYFYETLTHSDYIQIMLAFSKLYDTYSVKSYTLIGDTNHQTGEIKADILIPNIPVKNGVIHIISKPLAIFDKKLNKFPYVDIIDKFSMDPFLNITYYLASKSGFNSYLKGNKKYTFFIPRDSAWKSIDTTTLLHPSYLELVKTILSRHLIVGEVPYFMDSLVDASKDGCVHLNTPNGRICLAATKTNTGKYFVNWKGIFVMIYRGDYECKNGIVHIIDRPFISPEDLNEIPKESISSFQLWGAVISLLFGKN